MCFCIIYVVIVLRVCVCAFDFIMYQIDSGSIDAINITGMHENGIKNECT